MGHSWGTLLLGQAVGAGVGDGTAGRSKDNRDGVRAILGQSRHRDPIWFVASAGELLVDLASDVTFE